MIFTIIIKNLRILFRSPFSLLLLIITPIALVTLIGISYTSNNLSNIEIGVVNSQNQSFSIKGINIIEYYENSAQNNLQSCIKDLKSGAVDLCMVYEFQENSNLIIEFYSDNTRNFLSNILIDSITRRFEEESDSISYQSVDSIITNIKKSLTTLEEGRDLITELKKDLEIAEEQITLINEEFDSNYPLLLENIEELEDAQSDLLGAISNLKRFQDREIEESIVELEEQLETLNNIEDGLISIRDSPTFQNISNSQVQNELNSLISQVRTTKNNLGNVIELLETYNQFSNSVNFEEVEESVLFFYSNIDYVKNQLEVVNETLDNISSTVTKRKNSITAIESSIDEEIEKVKIVSSLNTTNIVNPISFQRNDMFSKFSSIHQFSPQILSMFVIFVTLLLSNIIVKMETHSNAHFRNLISPISQTQFIIAMYITSLLVMISQLMVFLVIYQYIFNIPVFSSILDIIIVSIHGISVFILFGILLAYLISNPQISILFTTFSALFVLFLSNSIVPLELMPDIFYTIYQFNPSVLLSDLLRKIFFYNDVVSLTFVKLLPFYIYSICIIIAISLVNLLRGKE